MDAKRGASCRCLRTVCRCNSPELPSAGDATSFSSFSSSSSAVAMPVDPLCACGASSAGLESQLIAAVQKVVEETTDMLDHLANAHTPHRDSSTLFNLRTTLITLADLAIENGPQTKRLRGINIADYPERAVDSEPQQLVQCDSCSAAPLPYLPAARKCDQCHIELRLCSNCYKKQTLHCLSCASRAIFAIPSPAAAAESK